MFSGGDSSGEGVSTLNQLGQFQVAARSAAACGLKTTTTASGSIDWASLAQQWIQMRDFSGADIGSVMPDAPPPPNISGNYVNDASQTISNRSAGATVMVKKTRFDEQGEADMEMDDDEDNERTDKPCMQSQQSALAPFMQPSWNTQNALPHTLAGNEIAVDEQQVPGQWNVWPSRMLSTPTPMLKEISHPTAHIPSLMKINIPDPNMSNIKLTPETHTENYTFSSMDAAKRKILPAWIREGLEKMEREKQKQLERQQQTLIEEVDDGQLAVGNDAGDLPRSHLHMVNSKNRNSLESDNSSVNDDEDNERAAATTTASCIAKRSNTPLSFKDAEEHSAYNEALKTGKSYEQKLSDLMIVVRRTLTELLLEITNEEISIISHEAIKSHKTKGLAAYDDSSSDCSDSDSVESTKNDNCVNSEEEMKAIIRTKQKTFSKISEEIEERIAESTLREEQKLKYYTEQELQQEQQQQKLNREHDSGFELELGTGTSSNQYRASGTTMMGPSTYTSGKGFEKEFGETSESKLHLSNGKRHKERTSRFSDNKDSRGAAIVTAADYISQLKSSQIENAAQKINSVVLNSPRNDSSKKLTEIASKSSNSPLSDVQNAAEYNLGKVRTDKTISNKQREPSTHSSNSNDSSSSDSDSEDTSNSSQNSSKKSRSLSSRRKSTNRHYRTSSSSSTRKSTNERSRDRYYDRYSSRRRYRSSDSDDYVEEKHGNSEKNHRNRSSHNRGYHRERKSGRTRSRSRSRSRSSYSSSRRRH